MTEDHRGRPSYLKMPGRSEMVCAALSRQAMSGRSQVLCRAYFLLYNGIGAIYGNKLIPWLL